MSCRYDFEMSNAVAASANESDPALELAFSRFLKFWRTLRELSQEELAHQLGSSPRHISRLENGVNQPGEALVKELAKVLKLGQRDSNHLLVSAGYIPLEQRADFHAPELKWLRKAMTLTLRGLDPYPTIVMDSTANILMVNRGWVGFYLKSIAPQTLAKVTNHFDFLFSHRGAGNLLSNWENTLSAILMSLQQTALFTNKPEDQAIVSRLSSHPNVPEDWQQRGANFEPMASYRVQVEFYGTLHRFFSVSSTVSAMGPVAYAPEPRLILNTLYPEDEELDLAAIVSTEYTHPLLFY